MGLGLPTLGLADVGMQVMLWPGLISLQCREQGPGCRVAPWGPCLGAPGPSCRRRLGRAAGLRPQVTGLCESSRELKSSSN